MAGDIRPSLEFLMRHWPDQAPALLFAPFPGERRDRMVLVGDTSGLPLLVQVVDPRKPVGDFFPPTLAVMVARPIAPQGDPLSSDAGRWLAGIGCTVWWTRS